MCNPPELFSRHMQIYYFLSFLKHHWTAWYISSGVLKKKEKYYNLLAYCHFPCCYMWRWVILFKLHNLSFYGYTVNYFQIDKHLSCFYFFIANDVSITIQTHTHTDIYIFLQFCQNFYFQRINVYNLMNILNCSSK